MTIQTNDRRKEYPGNGVTTIFAGPRAFSASHIAVYSVVNATNAATLLASGYTLTGVGANNTVVTLDAPTAASITNDKTLLILRTVPYEQQCDISNQGAYLPETLEDAGLDPLAQQTQQLADGITRTIRLADTAILPPGFTSELPGPSPTKPLVWNAAGTALENGDTALTGDLLLRGNLASVVAGYGSKLVAFLQSGIGAVARTVQDKLREISVSAKDLGAIGDGVADDLAKIQAAVTAANGREVVFPPGNYRISASYAAPAGSRLRFEPGAVIVPDGAFTFTSSGTVIYDQPGKPDFGAFGGKQAASSAAGSGNAYNFFQFKITSDTVSQVSGVNGASGSKVNGFMVTHNFGGPASNGGRQAMFGQLLHGYGGPASSGYSATSVDRNYVGMQGQVLSDAYEGGVAGTPRGQFFGASFYAGISNAADQVQNVTGCEFNTVIAAGGGTRVNVHTGLQIASSIGERGYGVDTAIGVSNMASGTKGYKYGLFFGDYAGRFAFDSDSTVLKVQAGKTIDKVIDVTGVTTTSLVKSDNVNLTNNGFVHAAAGVALDLGSTSAANTPVIDLHSSGNNIDYDVRLSATGGTASVGQGTLTVSAATTVTNKVRPAGDNTSNLGDPSFRWATVYAGTGTINTSDARTKTAVAPMSDAELAAAKALSRELGTFQFLASIAEKGDGARLHIGMTVQRAIEIMAAHGLDPFAYAFICHDSWEAAPEVWHEREAVPAVLDPDGNEIEPAQPAVRQLVHPAREAGGRYGFRADQLLAFIARGLEARLSALEA